MKPENIESNAVSIVPSSNSENIKDILPENLSFSFLTKNLNPTLTINITQPKLLIILNIINHENILNIKLIYEYIEVQDFKNFLESYYFLHFYCLIVSPQARVEMTVASHVLQ